MPEERSDPVWLDDIESPPESRSPKRLCIISGDALPSGEFIAALQTAVGSNQEIEIIRERRRGGSGVGPGQPPIERRRLQHVEALVKMDGYAIVPLPPTATRPARVPDPPMSVPPIERPVSVPPVERPMSFPPIERRPAEPRSSDRSPFLRRAFGGESETDELELARIMEFKRRRRMRLGFPLVVTALVAVVMLLLFQLPAVKSFMSRMGTPPAERAGEPSRTAQAPSPGTPSAPDRSDESRPSAGRESAERAPEPGVAPRAQVGTAPPAQTSPAPQAQPGPAPQAQSAPAPQVRTSPVPQAEPSPAPRVQPSPAPRVEPAPVPRPQPSPAPRAEVPETRRQTGPIGLPATPPSTVSPRQGAVGRASETLRGEASRFPGVPRVELTRSSLPTPEGKAESYVVRLSDPAGRPLAGAEVLLLAGMSDGTVESIMLHDGPEPGTYSGTSRPTRSAPVDLRVRMTMSDKRIEVPLRP